MDTGERNVRIPNIMAHPGSGGPWEQRTLEVAAPGNSGHWKWRPLGVSLGQTAVQSLLQSKLDERFARPVKRLLVYRDQSILDQSRLYTGDHRLDQSRLNYICFRLHVIQMTLEQETIQSYIISHPLVIDEFTWLSRNI